MTNNSIFICMEVGKINHEKLIPISGPLLRLFYCYTPEHLHRREFYLQILLIYFHPIYLIFRFFLSIFIRYILSSDILNFQISKFWFDNFYSSSLNGELFPIWCFSIMQILHFWMFFYKIYSQRDLWELWWLNFSKLVQYKFISFVIA